MKKEKQIIQTIEDFIAESILKGYSVKKVSEYEYSPFHLFKGDVSLFVKWKTKKISYRRSDYVGLVISKPSELLGRHDRSNSGQITITFGKAEVEDIFQKIEEMMSQYTVRLNAITAKRSADDMAMNEILLLMDRFEQFNPKLDHTKGFYISTYTTELFFPELKNLGCNELFYSHIDGKFMLVESSLPYGGVVKSYNRTTVNLDKFNAFVFTVQQIQKQIDILNEKYFR